MAVCGTMGSVQLGAQTGRRGGAGPVGGLLGGKDPTGRFLHTSGTRVPAPPGDPDPRPVFRVSPKPVHRESELPVRLPRRKPSCSKSLRLSTSFANRRAGGGRWAVPAPPVALLR